MNSIKKTMKAAVYTRWGSPEMVLKIKEVDKPVPKENEVLIKNFSTTVTAADMRLLGLHVPTGFGILLRLAFGWGGPRNPKKQILGLQSAGVIEAVGENVTDFKIFDSVLVHQGFQYMGAHAEYSCLPETGLIIEKSESMTYDQAASLGFGGITALEFLRDVAKIQDGHKLLVYGASGDVGTYAIQLGKYYGADVTGVCSTNNLELIKSLGADRVIDYTREDFTADGEKYDVIFDTVGKLSFSNSKRSLHNSGKFLMAVGGIPDRFFAMLNNKFNVIRAHGKKILLHDCTGTREDLVFLCQLFDKGFIKAVIDRHYPLEEIAEAHSYVLNGHKVGSVVVNMNNYSEGRE